MKKAPLTLAAMFAAALISGCSSSIDASSLETLKETENEVRKSLGTEQSIFFDRARGYLLSYKGMEDYRIMVDGMSGEKVIKEGLKLEKQKHNEKLTELKKGIDEAEAIENQISGIEFINYDAIDVGDGNKSSVPKIDNVFTIKNNSGLDIYGYQLRGTFEYKMTEQMTSNGIIRYPAGEYPYTFRGPVQVVFEEGVDPIKDGEEHTHTIHTPPNRFGFASALPSRHSIPFTSGGEITRKDITIEGFVDLDDDGKPRWVTRNSALPRMKTDYEKLQSAVSTINKKPFDS